MFIYFLFYIFATNPILMKYWFLLIPFITLLACSKPQKAPYLTLKPDLPIEGQAELYFLEDDYTLFDVAQSNEESTKLYFRKDSVPEGIYELRINNKPIAPLIISSTMPFSLSGNFNLELEKLAINNNDETKALWQAQIMTNALSEEIKKIAANLPDSLPETDFLKHKDSLYQEVNRIIDDTRDKLNKLSKKHQKSLLPLLLVKLQAGNHLIFHPENNSDDYYEVSNHLKGRYPDYAPVQKFSFQIDSLMNWNVFNSITKEGRKLPSLTLPNAWGQNHTIDSISDKPTLFIIWNSSEERSKEMSKNLMRWTWPYRKKGLQICMISLDDNKKEWLNTIKKDRLAFLHLSDLKGQQSPVLEQLGLSTIPTFLLVNKDKTIVKRSTELEMLTKSITEIIKN